MSTKRRSSFRIERRRNGFRRRFGLDRSGPPPRETRPGQPLRPWTIPNLIGYARLAAIPVFLYLALNSDGGNPDPTSTRGKDAAKAKAGRIALVASRTNTALSLQIFSNATSSFAAAQDRAWGAALTLMLLTFIATLVARAFTARLALER